MRSRKHIALFGIDEDAARQIRMALELLPLVIVHVDEMINGADVVICLPRQVPTAREVYPDARIISFVRRWQDADQCDAELHIVFDGTLGRMERMLEMVRIATQRKRGPKPKHHPMPWSRDQKRALLVSAAKPQLRRAA